MRAVLVCIACVASPVAAQQGGVVNTPSASQPIIAVSNSPPPPSQIIVAPMAFPPAAPLPPFPHVVRAPQPRAATSSYITPDDYPASALAARQQGRVDFTLVVGANGRASGCMINRSSGSSVLDSTTCRLMRSRARFTPAMDSNGNPATAAVRLHFEWRLHP